MQIDDAIQVSEGVRIKIVGNSSLGLAVGQITIVLGVTRSREYISDVTDVEEVRDGESNGEVGVMLVNLDGESFVNNDIEEEAPGEVGAIVATNNGGLHDAESFGVGTTRLGNGHEVNTEVLEQVDGLFAEFASLFVLNSTLNLGTIVVLATTIAEVDIHFELMTAVITDGVEHLQGRVTFLDKFLHGGSGQTGTLSILERIVGIDTDVLGLTHVIADGQTLGGLEVDVVVRVVVLVGVGTGILDKLDKVARLFVVCTDR